MRLGNREISDRCGLPRSTVSRLTWTLTQIGQLTYLPEEQKYAAGPNAFAFGTSLLVESWERAAFVGERKQTGIHASARLASSNCAPMTAGRS